MDPEQTQAAARFIEQLKEQVHTPTEEAIRDHIDKACKQAMWMDRVDMERSPDIQVRGSGGNTFVVSIETDDEGVQRTLRKHGIFHHMELAFFESE